MQAISHVHWARAIILDNLFPSSLRNLGKIVDNCFLLFPISFTSGVTDNTTTEKIQVKSTILYIAGVLLMYMLQELFFVSIFKE